MESLLGQGDGEPEAPQDRHPDDSWRTEALAGSRHARLTDHLRAPLEIDDEIRAAEICAEACRHLLPDFAPALTLLPQVERRRCQALSTYAQTLFDFAAQGGVEGERLAALNRVGFELEQALDSGSAGQPSFLRMAVAERQRSWNREALDDLARLARRRVVKPRPSVVAEAEADADALGAAIASALPGAEPGGPAARLGSALIRICALLDLGEAMRRERARLPTSELPPRRQPGEPVPRETIDRAVLAEVDRVREVMPERDWLAAVVPADYRRAALYLRSAGLRLLRLIESLGADVVQRPPRLGAARRLLLLLRARLAILNT